MEFGVQGTGLMWIEHFELVSVADNRINDYENCLYACRFCNSSRYVTRTINDNGRRLLDPCRQVWSERFSLDEGDRLLPAEADPDACYTSETYDINDSRKVLLRRLRRERLADWLDLIREGGSHIRSLLEVSQRADSLEDATFLIAEATRLHDRIDFAKVQIQRYAAVPADADPSCHCGRKEQHDLPQWLASQTEDLSLDDPSNG